MASACALVRADGLCLAPPRSWAKQFERLSSVENSTEENHANVQRSTSCGPESGGGSKTDRVE